jgi:hypothetical protein
MPTVTLEEINMREQKSRVPDPTQDAIKCFDLCPHVQVMDTAKMAVPVLVIAIAACAPIDGPLASILRGVDLVQVGLEVEDEVGTCIEYSLGLAPGPAAPLGTVFSLQLLDCRVDATFTDTSVDVIADARAAHNASAER